MEERFYSFICTESGIICAVHLINDGITINGNTATVEYVTNGPTDKTVCTLDRQPFFSCELHRHNILYETGMHGCVSSGFGWPH